MLQQRRGGRVDESKLSRNAAHKNAPRQKTTLSAPDTKSPRVSIHRDLIPTCVSDESHKSITRSLLGTFEILTEAVR